MSFIKKFLSSLTFLLVLGLIFYNMFPDVVKPMINLYKGFLGPGLLFLTIIFSVLPRRRSR